MEEESLEQINQRINNKICQDKSCSRLMCGKLHLPFTSPIKTLKQNTDTQDQEKLNNLKRIYEQIQKHMIDEKGFKLLATQFNAKKQKITISFTIDKFLDHFSYTQVFKILEKKKKIYVQSILGHQNGEFIQVEDHYIRLLMARFFIRLNCTFRFGCFTIHPLSGEIVLKMNSFMTEDIFDSIIYQKNENLITYLKTCIQTTHLALSFHTYKIFHMINLIPEEIFHMIDPQNKAQKIRFPNEDCKPKLENIKKILKDLSLQKYDTKITTKQQNSEYFRYPKQNASNGLTVNIYSELDLAENDGLVLHTYAFNGGGFAEVYKAKIKYKDRTGQEYQRTVAVKTDKDKDKKQTSRIEHEKAILSQLKDKDCPYIAKFYFSENPLYKDHLMMEFYPNKSFDNFKQCFSTTMSLNTKIYLLYQISQGIRFLIENNIYHLDLKPANILISKNYIAKITDFGESYHPEVCKGKQFKPGRTLPFASPEVIKDSMNNQKYHERVDIFSLGILMSDLLFDEYPVDFKRGSQHILSNKYMSNKYTYKLAENNLKSNGPKHLMKLLIASIYQCLEEKNNRPYIEWLVIILRDALFYIEKMY